MDVSAVTGSTIFPYSIKIIYEQNLRKLVFSYSLLYLFSKQMH